MLRHDIPKPRNAVELPIYVYLTWGFWPPIQLLLGLPYRDLDDLFSAYGARVVRMDRRVRETLEPYQAEVLAAMPIEERDCGGTDFIIINGRTARRGPKRAPDSLQLVLDIGFERRARAIAWILLWRDRAIIRRNLGVEELRDLARDWWTAIEPLADRVRQERHRLRGKGVTVTGRWMPTDTASFREAAVICARGAAACCGGSNADELIEAAFARYEEYDELLRTIDLPKQDPYRYDYDVRGYVQYFSAPGAELADYSSERTHMVISGRPPRDADAAELEAFVASGEIEL